VGTAVFLSNDHNPLNILLVGASYYITSIVGVCLHELGHAWGGLSAGANVSFIELGRRHAQWKPWQVRFLGITWLINSAPTMGLAHVSFSTAERYRERQCWMIACGPLTNLALLVAGLLLGFFGERSLLPFALGWCLAQASLCFISIFPHMARFPDQQRPNDGLLFWQTLQISDSDVEQQILAGRIARQFGEFEAMARCLTLEELTEQHNADPANVSVLWHLAYRLAEVHDPRSAPYFGKLVADPDLPEALLPDAIDTFLTLQLHVGPPADPNAADLLSQRLLTMTDTISTRGTRGSVLVDIGRSEEGKQLLNEVLTKTTSKLDKTYANAFLSLAAQSEGNLTAARDYAWAAREADPGSPVLARVADLL